MENFYSVREVFRHALPKHQRPKSKVQTPQGLKIKAFSRTSEC